jgi:hypothetical protein
MCQIDNLDAFASADLLEQWSDRFASVNPSTLFPGVRLTDAATAQKQLVQYARLKARAMRHRLEGHIMNALLAEQACDKIYEGLPLYARW